MGDDLEQCVAEPVGGDGLINPELFPCRAYNLNTDDITGAADDLRAMGKAVEDETTSIDTTWSRLTSSYHAPEQESVYALMDPAVTSATELKTALDSAAGHLDTYAGELSAIRQTLWDFVGTASAFRREVEGGVYVDASSAKDASFGDMVVGAGDWIPGVDEEQVLVPWYEDGDTVDRNKELLEEYGGILSQISTAAATCANGINALVTGMCVAEVEAIPAEAFTSPEMPMPWGYPRDEDRNCPESVGHGASNFGYSIYSGAASLIGYDTESGDWGWDVAGQAWGGLGNFLGSTVVLVTFTPHLAALGVPMPDGVSDWLIERGDVAAAGWTSLVGYDYYTALEGGDGWHAWKEDGVAAGTEAVLNVGTFFIPGAGQVGAALKTGSMGARLMRIVAGGADLLVPGGSFAVKGGVTAVTGLRGALRFGDDVPTGPGLGARFNPAALLDDVTDVPTPPVDRTSPVSNDLFGDGPGGLPDRPQTTVPDTTPQVPEQQPGGNQVPEQQPGGSQVPEQQPGGSQVPEQQPGGNQVPEQQPGGNQVPEQQPGGNQGSEQPPDGTHPTEPGSGNRYDPDAEPPTTVAAKDRPEGTPAYTPDDVQQALDDAPVNEHGDPVDPRTGKPLLLERSDGARGWEMRWDTENETWVAQNHGDGHTSGLDPRGEPNSFGYDANGDRMPYANNRPSYGPTQVDDVWDAALDENGEVWVPDIDGNPYQIEWSPGEPRDGVWDMGHRPDSKYSELRQRYLNHEIDLDEFLEEYRDPDNYQVEDPDLNQSHRNEDGSLDLDARADAETAAAASAATVHSTTAPPTARAPIANGPAAADNPLRHGGDDTFAGSPDHTPDPHHTPDPDRSPEPDPDATPVRGIPLGNPPIEPGPLSSLASPVAPGDPRMAIHAGSADPATLDAAMRAEYPVLREVNVDRFDANRPGHSMNCTRCVIAADRALSGAPSSAMPLAGPSSIGDVTGALGGTPRPVQGYGEIVDIMAANPPGTRGVVMIARPGQVGHVFTVIHDRNGVVFLDTQVGRFGYLEPNVKLQLIVVPHSAQTTVSAPFAMPEATPAPPATAPGGGVSTPMPRVPVLVEAGHAGTESYRNEER